MTNLTARSMSGLPEGRVIPFPDRRFADPGEPFEGKWPAWKVATGVVLFCGAFWWGAIALIGRLVEALVR